MLFKGRQHHLKIYLPPQRQFRWPSIASSDISVVRIFIHAILLCLLLLAFQDRSCNKEKIYYSPCNPPFDYLVKCIFLVKGKKNYELIFLDRKDFNFVHKEQEYMIPFSPGNEIQ